ncbi:MAG: immunoglobulin domain-containing protein [Verrucomicrobia bacterium]|nr:immunoglobulin domain-containing protein [Verrucomicrobiota bacterium]
MKTPNSLPRNQSLALLARSGWFVLAAVASACLSLPLRADLVAHWTFDEAGGSVATDAVGSFHGTLSVTGAGFVGGGVSGNAISLNRASGGFVNMGNVLPLTSGDFSIVTWVKMNAGDTTPESVILGKHQSGGVNGYFLGVNPAGGVGENNKAIFYAGGLVSDGPVSASSVNDGNWHQVVGVYRSGVNKVIYVDGVVEATNSAPVVEGNTAAFLIGGISGSGPAGLFTGLVDEVQVYNHALNPDDVAYLFQNPGEVITPPPPSVAPIAHWTFDEAGGSVANDAVGGFHGTLSVAGAGFVSGGVSGNAISLNRASGGFVNMGNVLQLTSGDFSIVAWVKMNPGDTAAETILLSKHQAGSVNGYFLLANQTGGGGQNNKATFYAGGLVTAGAVSQTSINDGNWHQVVGVYRSGVNKVIYVNGVPESTNSAPVVSGNTAPFLVGGISQSGAFTGLLDDIQVYNHALNPDDIAFLFQNPGQVLPAPPPCLPPPADVVSWWKADGNLLDETGGNNGSLAGNAAFGAGHVGQGFVFDGHSDAVLLGNPATLRLQNFTIEAWIKRTSTAYVSSGPGVDGLFFGYGAGGYGFGLDRDSGRPMLTTIDVDAVFADTSITDTNFHHLAVTKSGSSVVFYVDGVAYTAPAYSPTFSFTTVATIGARGDNLGNSFYGSVDELAIYSRALAANEIQAIFDAGSKGKCSAFTKPIIVSQPASRTVIVGANVTFSVVADGTTPLSYQWSFNGTNLSGATSSSLTLSNAQFSDAGAYSVVVSNLAGTTASTVATLTVNPIPPCAPPASGLVSWWPGAGNALDIVGGNNGVLTGHTAYAVGKVGQGFVFDGNTDAVVLGNPASLRLQTFTIEAWVRRASTAYVSSGPGIDGCIFGYGGGGYGFALDRISGRPMLTRIGASSVAANVSIADTNYHHLAVTKSGSTVVFYIDGVAHAAPAYATTFAFTTSAAIGARGDNLGNSFYGSVDDLAIYNRALSATEIQAIYNAGSSGKCDLPPIIASHPADQTVTVGGAVTFNVTASGTLPLSYQWRRNSTDLEGATGSSLTLANVQMADAGSYSVVVTNAVGTATSSNATLTVNLPPAAVIVSSANAASASTVTLPVLLVANGNENALGFSLDFNPALLSFDGVTLGSSAVGASLLVNTNQIGSGRIGLALALPTDITFPAGNQEALRLEFSTAIVTEAAETTITFGDVPISRQVSDAPGNPLPATYANGTVAIGAVTYEGDVAPRPDGDRNVTITDWVLAGRYAARLDYPTNAAEFQRADNAPRTTLGDGMITVTDWVQAGRYAAALDPLTPVGGPSAEIAGGQAAGGVVRQAGDDGGPGRQLQVAAGLLLRDQSVTLGVSLQAMGDENALGFSVSFDPAILNFAGAAPGAGAVGATLHVNSQQAGTGRLGLVLALASGSTFSAGTAELAKLTFNAATPASTNCLVALVDQPVPRQISDANAMPLAATYQDATITVNPLPVLRIVHLEQDIVLSWPLWASNYTLQEASGTLLPPVWTAVEGVPGTGTGEHQLTQPLTGDGKFFRLIAQ